MDSNDGYKRDLEARLAAWERALDAVRAHGAELPLAARAELLEDLRAYRELRAAALARLDALIRAADGGRPAPDRQSADALWRDLGSVVDALTTRYR